MTTTLDVSSRDNKSLSASNSTATRKKLLVVGGGMAAHGLCQRLTDEGASGYEIVIFGEEPHLAYDRVNLSKLFDGKTQDDLLLSSEAWYRDNQIEFVTGCRIERIDREQKHVVGQDGQHHAYDQLVLATGSRAFVPPIPGADLPGVFVYRTLDDLTEIEQHVRSTGAAVGTVIGGGLLGLEAAKVLDDLGLKTSVVEMAPGLMPRQLDAPAAGRLRRAVEALGVDVHVVRRTEKIESIDGGRLRIRYSNAQAEEIDILIIAAGIRPNDELAKQSGLELGSRGGIAVDEHLQTSDPDIFAIGECAAFRDHIYGLVAPCYRMAETLAARLLGRAETFAGADESAELKLMGVQVVTLGRAIGQSAGGIVLTQEDEHAYRRLLLEQGKIVGAACVGPWEELPQIRQAVQNHRMLWPLQRTRFRRTGSPWAPGGALPVTAWPANAIVCSCVGVSRGQITEAIDSGAETVEQITQITRAGTACGSCQSLVCELAGTKTEPTVAAGTKTMLAASIIAAVLTLLSLVLSPMQLAASVQDSWRNIDVLWRDDFARQVTGFTTLGLTVLGLVFSLRKRIGWFQFGSYTFWRSVHGVLGAAVLVAVAVHTGLRMGENLNFLLSCVFLATAALGAVVGIVASFESRATGTWVMLIRQWRPRLTQIHTWLFWPLPALVAMHVLSFYWFSD